jgi:hypothetical protein
VFFVQNDVLFFGIGWYNCKYKKKFAVQMNKAIGSVGPSTKKLSQICCHGVIHGVKRVLHHTLQPKWVALGDSGTIRYTGDNNLTYTSSQLVFASTTKFTARAHFKHDWGEREREKDKRLRHWAYLVEKKDYFDRIKHVILL